MCVFSVCVFSVCLVCLVCVCVCVCFMSVVWEWWIKTNEWQENIKIKGTFFPREKIKISGPDAVKVNFLYIAIARILFACCSPEIIKSNVLIDCQWASASMGKKIWITE
jgi:hypothetical protein